MVHGVVPWHHNVSTFANSHLASCCLFLPGSVSHYLHIADLLLLIYLVALSPGAVQVIENLFWLQHTAHN